MCTKIINRKQVCEKCNRSRSGIYYMVKPGSPMFDPTFPRPVKIGARSIGWIESEIDDWIKTKATAREAV